MADKKLPSRLYQSPDPVEGDPSSTPAVKNGEAEQPETPGTEQPARPSTPVAQTSANPDDAHTKADPPADGYCQRLPFLVGSPSYLKRVEAMGIEVEAFSLSPETTARAMDWHEAQLSQPSSEATGSPKQETRMVPHAGGIPSRSSGLRPAIFRWPSWPPLYYIPEEDEEEQQPLSRTWHLMRERAWEG